MQRLALSLGTRYPNSYTNGYNLRKKLKDVTHVLGELPTKAVKLNLYWCDGNGSPRARGRKVGPQKNTMRRIK